MNKFKKHRIVFSDEERMIEQDGRKVQYNTIQYRSV
jgi:hypothetical protein